MERDPMEEDLLAQLEDLAQKTDVLTHWADEMYEFVKAIPISKPSPRKPWSPAEMTPHSQSHCLTLASSRGAKMRLTSKPTNGRTRTYKRSITLWLAWRSICS